VGDISHSVGGVAVISGKWENNTAEANTIRKTRK
jgi:hypothetical protein